MTHIAIPTSDTFNKNSILKNPLSTTFVKCMFLLPVIMMMLGSAADIYSQDTDKPFITIWKTDHPGETGDNQIAIPIEGTGYDITIEWGDGSTTTWQDGDSIEGLTHTYESPGTYTVYIFGDFPRIYFNNEGDKEKILSIEGWGDIVWQTMELAFRGASNLEITATDAPDLTGVTSMESMFRGASSLNSDLNHWDTGNVTNMGSLFWGANSFNGDIGSWDTSNVTNMSSMFVDATEFNRFIGGWDISKVTNISQMFASTSSFNQDLSGWNTTSVSNMAGIFLGAVAFNRPLDSWDFSNVNNMSNLLNNAGLATHHYDRLLMSWAKQEMQFNLDVGARGLEYCGALSARRYLINEKGWQINEDSVADACQEAFITLWLVEEGDLQITIPTEGTGYNYDVRWGDGNESQNLIGNASHTFNEPGLYPVVISGDFPRIYFNNEGDREKIIELTQWGNIQWQSMESAFNGAENMELTAMDTPDLSQVTSLEQMFRLTGITGTLGNWDWDTGNIINLERTFMIARDFNGDITGWNTSSVETLRETFHRAFRFNQNISGWDVSNVTSMFRTFGRSLDFNQDISNWDVSNVTNFALMFSFAIKFDQNLNNWDMRSATQLFGMFSEAEQFNGDISGWNVSNSTTFFSMFRNAISFNRDISNWDISSATRTYQMFQGASSFNSDISNWDVSNVTRMYGMFHGASSFDQNLGGWNVANVHTFDDESIGFLDGSGLSVANYDALLNGWSQLNLQTDNEISAVGLVYCDGADARQSIIDDFGWTFIGDANCFDGKPFITIWQTDNDGDSENNQITIPTINDGYYYSIYWESAEDETLNGTVTGATGDATITFPEAGMYRVEINGVFPRIHFDNRGDMNKLVDIIQWGDIEWASMERAFWGASKLNISATDAPDLTKVTSMADMFRDAESFNTDIGHWNTENVENMRSLFYSATSFNQDISGWNVSNVESMSNMFRHAVQFNQDLNGWDTGMVTDMSRMFRDAESFNGNISGWNTSNVESMTRMFMDAVAFNQDVGNWNTAKVTQMDIMFEGAATFNQDISGWNTTSVTSMRRMFQDAESFNQDISNWNMENVTETERMFQGATSFNGIISDWNTVNVISMSYMFEDAVSFNQDISGWDTRHLDLMEDMFKNAVSFNQNIGNWDVSNVTWFGDLFDNTNLSIANYDSTLIGWASQGVHNDMIIGSEGLQFCKGADARQNLIDDNNWTFTGDSEMCGLVLDAPTLTSPADEATTTDEELLFEWATVDSAESYTFQLSNEIEFNQLIITADNLAETEYSFTEPESNTTYYWRVRAEADTVDGPWSDVWTFSTGVITSIDETLNYPEEIELAQNYPNPFNPATQIRYSLPEQKHVKISVYNTLGQRVAILVNENQNAGRHKVSFDASALSSGMYIYRMQAGSYTETRQMLLIK